MCHSCLHLHSSSFFPANPITSLRLMDCLHSSLQFTITQEKIPNILQSSKENVSLGIFVRFSLKRDYEKKSLNSPVKILWWNPQSQKHKTNFENRAPLPKIEFSSFHLQSSFISSDMMIYLWLMMQSYCTNLMTAECQLSGAKIVFLSPKETGAIDFFWE